MAVLRRTLRACDLPQRLAFMGRDCDIPPLCHVATLAIRHAHNRTQDRLSFGYWLLHPFLRRILPE
jgi:hypothetical protein